MFIRILSNSLCCSQFNEVLTSNQSPLII
uniref:Uncharacterized protein n=1 Tax=Rhizophora mucronata TaxID=61149 RepID=A0A2P2QM91_RHIMU